MNTGCPHSRGRKEPRGEKAGEESLGGKNPQWGLGLQVPVKTFVIKSLTLIVASTYFGECEWALWLLGLFSPGKRSAFVLGV